jgi:hypothetical protein
LVVVWFDWFLSNAKTSMRNADIKASNQHASLGGKVRQKNVSFGGQIRQIETGRILTRFLVGKARCAVRCPAHSRPPPDRRPKPLANGKTAPAGTSQRDVPTIQGRCQDAPPKIAGKLFQRILADSTRLRRVSM